MIIYIYVCVCVCVCVYIYICIYIYIIFFSVLQAIFSPGASLVVQMVRSLSAMEETWVRSLGWEHPWKRKCLPTPVFLPGESHGQRNLAGYSPCGFKESYTTEWLTFTTFGPFSQGGPSNWKQLSSMRQVHIMYQKLYIVLYKYHLILFLKQLHDIYIYITGILF